MSPPDPDGLDPRRVDARRALPAVDWLLGTPEAAEWSQRWGREPVKAALRGALDEARAGVATGSEAPRANALLRRAHDLLRLATRPSLRRVLNGTGVVLHTNLGRAPLAAQALEAVLRAAPGYSNLEYELQAGRRGSRYEHCTALLRELTGSEAALVVNNNAAAVALTVNELARGREVLISRGELIEIGGAFRIPDVVERAGATLVEVGTTNRTRLEDYRRAIGAATAAILKVHPSNYTISGYVASASLEELASLGRERGLPLVHDLGSGLLLPALLPGFPHEPSPSESVAAGANVVCWSADKLLGGPQAGIIHGTRDMIGRLRRNPLLRAFRVDKMTIAALEATLLLYRDPEMAVRSVPALAMLREPVESVERRAREALDVIAEAAARRVTVRRMKSVVGGGAYPGFEIESAGWGVRGRAERLDACCRSAEPPLVGRVEEGELRIDFRTILPGEEREAARAVGEALQGERDGA